MAGIAWFGNLRGRVKRLEEAAEGMVAVLVCPLCKEEFTVYGDAPLEFLCEEWRRESGAETYRETPGEVLRLFDHEHKASNFVEKRSGELFLGEFFSGMKLGVRPEDVEDLSE